mgnify:CR=1 FL=1
MDETLRVNVTLTALNADGLPTRNYAGAFAKLPTGTFLPYGISPGYTLGARSQPTGVNLSARISGASLTLGELSNLQPGDVVVLGNPVDEPATVSIDDIELF